MKKPKYYLTKDANRRIEKRLAKARKRVNKRELKSLRKVIGAKEKEARYWARKEKNKRFYSPVWGQEIDWNKMKRVQVNQRSAPGEPPAVQTGRLFQSIKVFPTLEFGVVLIVATDQKAHLLELGTRNIAPRPFMRPALDRYTPKLPLIMKGLV